MGCPDPVLSLLTSQPALLFVNMACFVLTHLFFVLCGKKEGKKEGKTGGPGALSSPRLLQGGREIRGTDESSN